MANLSERLDRALEDITASPDVSDESFSALADAKSALDRLTVEGLAGVAGKAITAWTTGDDAPEDDLRTTIAQALLTYITGETHD